MKYFPGSSSDIEVVIRNKRPSKNNIFSGYRLAFKVKDDYLTTGIIKLIGIDELPHDNEGRQKFGLSLLNYIQIV